MKITNGKIITGIGILHSVLTVVLPVYAKPFGAFAGKLFFSISGGPMDSPETMGGVYYENFAAFWCFYFGLFVVLLGVLLDAIERRGVAIPGAFIAAYLIVTLIGVYMIPLSGMTIFFLPHALYMLYRNRKVKTM